jgi:hypothetical protein
VVLSQPLDEVAPLLLAIGSSVSARVEPSPVEVLAAAVAEVVDPLWVEPDVPSPTPSPEVLQPASAVANATAFHSTTQR